MERGREKQREWERERYSNALWLPRNTTQEGTKLNVFHPAVCPGSTHTNTHTHTHTHKHSIWNLNTACTKQTSDRASSHTHASTHAHTPHRHTHTHTLTLAGPSHIFTQWHAFLSCYTPPLYNLIRGNRPVFNHETIKTANCLGSAVERIKWRAVKSL